MRLRISEILVSYFSRRRRVSGDYNRPFRPGRFGVMRKQAQRCTDAVIGHTTGNAGTIACMRGIGSRSTGGDTPGTLLRCRTYSTCCRSRKPRSPFCAATTRIVDIGSVAPTGRGFSLDQLRDPKPRTFWRGHSRGRTCSGVPTFAADGNAGSTARKERFEKNDAPLGCNSVELRQQCGLGGYL